MLTFVHIPANDAPRILTSEKGDTYRTIRDAVGGPIEPVPVEDHVLYVHEEGKLLGLPLNDLATRLTRDFLSPWDLIVGDAVLAGPTDDEGEDTSVQESMLRRLGLPIPSIDQAGHSSQ